MSEYRYLLTFDRMLPVGIVGIVCTALGRHYDPEPELIIEDGRLVVVQPLPAIPAREQPTGAEAPVTSAPAPSPHPAAEVPGGVSPRSVPDPGTGLTPSHGDGDPTDHDVNDSPGVDAGGGAELVEPAVGGSAGSTDTLRCPECGAGFDRPQGLGAHRRYTHGVKGGARAERIERAAASAPIPVPAEPLPPRPVTAITDVLGDSRQRWECDHCGARFASKRSLGQHRADEHPILGRPA